MSYVRTSPPASMTISTRSPFMNQTTPARPQIVPDLRFRGSGRARALPRDSPLLARSPLLRPESASTAGHDNRNDIREFLTARRERLTPQEAGLPDFGGRRRVKDLRREEVALLAGVSGSTTSDLSAADAVHSDIQTLVPGIDEVSSGRGDSTTHETVRHFRGQRTTGATAQGRRRRAALPRPPRADAMLHAGDPPVRTPDEQRDENRRVRMVTWAGSTRNRRGSPRRRRGEWREGWADLPSSSQTGDSRTCVGNGCCLVSVS